MAVSGLFSSYRAQLLAAATLDAPGGSHEVMPRIWHVLPSLRPALEDGATCGTPKHVKTSTDDNVVVGVKATTLLHSAQSKANNYTQGRTLKGFYTEPEDGPHRSSSRPGGGGDIREVRRRQRRV